MSDIRVGDRMEWRGDGKHVRGRAIVRVAAIGEHGFCRVQGSNGMSWWAHELRLTHVGNTTPPAQAGREASVFAVVCSDYDQLRWIGDLGGCEL